MNELDIRDIHKAAGILLRDRHLLVERSRGKDFFLSPGGKVEPGETAEIALVRELTEEFGIETDPKDYQHFGTFSAPSAGQEHRQLTMDVFIVRSWNGEITPGHEVQEVRWITSQVPGDIQLGSIFAHHVVPKLKAMDLID